jgi:hypothetical protein
VALEDVDALGGVEDVGGLHVRSNAQLTSLAGMARLLRVDGTGNPVFPGITIIGNDALTSIGLQALLEVDGPVEITRNALLPSLAGLEGLRTIRGSFEVASNDRLVSLNGLERLASVGDTTIASCPELRDLRALASLTTVDGLVRVSDNVKLPTCEAEWLRVRVEAIGALLFSEGTDDDATCP